MVLTFSSNISSLSAIQNLEKGTKSLSRGISKLSSGNRLTNAREDASSLAISNSLRRDLATAQAAQNNIRQATSILQITDGGFASIESKINRLSELASISQSGNITTTERNALDIEFQLLLEGITQDTLSTTFNGENLLGQRPEFVVDNIGSSIQNADGFVGFRFDNNAPDLNDGDVFETTYDATTGILQVENTRTSFRQTVNLTGPIADGELLDVTFDQLGVALTFSSDFDFATSLTPGVDGVNFTARTPAVAASSFVPTDLPGLILNLSGQDSPLNILGTEVQSVGDLEPTSGSNNATQSNASRRPEIAFGAIFGRDAFDFSNSNSDAFVIGNNSAINTSIHTQRTFAFNFQTGADVNTRQVIYEEGAGVNGIAAYIDAGQLYFNIHRASGGVRRFVSIPVTPNTDFTASFDFDNATNTIRGYLNGNLFGTNSALGAPLPAHSGGIGLGDANGSIRVHDNTNVSAGNGFQGLIGDFVLYNNTFTDADHANLDLHLRGGGPGIAGFSDETLQFKIDNTEGALFEYKKAQTDFLLASLAGSNIRSIASAITARTVLEDANQFVSSERAEIGALLSRLEFASTQIDVFSENTTNANSVIADTNLAAETTNVTSLIAKNRVTISVLTLANTASEQLLDLLAPPQQESL